jgi:sec-independent protein translocase protein TatA
MLNTVLLAMIGGPEIAIIVLALLLLFGGRKIPELMRGLGRGVREFKEGQAGTTKDDIKEEKQ